MSGAPASRRGFLRGLTTLPLVGGAVTLIGAPSAVAEPATDMLFNSYLAFIVHEHREVVVEHARRKAIERVAKWTRNGRSIPTDFYRSVEADTRELPYLGWVPHGSEGMRAFVERARPETRAALVLSTIGIDWREGTLCA